MRGTGAVALGFAMVAFGLAGCATTGETVPGASLGSSVEWVPSREATNRRVDEDGLRFKIGLEIDSLKGREVPVRLFDSANRLLGEAIATPRYEGSVWKEFSIFVAYSRLESLDASGSMRFYVVSPDDPKTFLATASINLPTRQLPSLIWRWQNWKLDASLPAGAEGFEVGADVHVSNRAGQQGMEVVLLLRDSDGNDLETADGEPLRFSGPTLGTPGSSTWVYQNLTLRVPYSALEHFDPSHTLVLTPAIRIGEKIEPGNIHIQFWAGGSISRQLKVHREDSERLEERITYLERQVEILRGGEAPR